ncbi:hypothetical protein DSM104443_02143 [Usitatibacter rugosus]|uniref:Protein TonB n=2 Tax=Usitatibacter rugosus TaxID=2732067 RepID=A0A6M4GVK5_9PROT|nr:hypothetical protein DSM104443_02143 [Usitatibacter rugosus]
MIIGAHVIAGIAVVSMGGVVYVAKNVPMLVQILPEPVAPKPATPLRPLPMPVMKPPEIRLPNPPVIENTITVRLEEKPVPQAPVPAPVAAVAAANPSPSVEPPRGDLAYLNNPAPSYPAYAKRAREQGVVMLRVRVDASGGVEGIEIHKSSGSQRLDDAALAAVKRWRFAPARMGDRPISGVALVPIHFQLEG